MITAYLGSRAAIGRRPSWGCPRACAHFAKSLRTDFRFGPDAEAAHVRPRGRPHHRADRLSNLLCLCANDHVLSDFGAIGVQPSTGELMGDRLREGRVLTVDSRHHLDSTNFEHHFPAICIPME